MSELTRKQVEGFLRTCDKSWHWPNRRVIEPLCRALLAAWDNEEADIEKMGRISGALMCSRDAYEAEAMAARELLRANGCVGPAFVGRADAEDAYAAARAANEAAEGGRE